MNFHQIKIAYFAHLELNPIIKRIERKMDYQFGGSPIEIDLFVVYSKLSHLSNSDPLGALRLFNRLITSNKRQIIIQSRDESRSNTPYVYVNRDYTECNNWRRNSKRMRILSKECINILKECK